LTVLATKNPPPISRANSTASGIVVIFRLYIKRAAVTVITKEQSAGPMIKIGLFGRISPALPRDTL
jgi:hypothetical protein